MLLTRRMERMGLKPLGFVANRLCAGSVGVATADQSAARPAVRRGHAGRRSRSVDGRIDHAGSARFRNVAVIAVPDRAAFPRRGEVAPPGHLQLRPDLRRTAQARAQPHLLRATRQDAAWQLADLKRLGDLLAPRQGSHRVSPGSTASRRSPCRSCWRSARNAYSTAPAEDELLDIAAQGTDRRRRRGSEVILSEARISCPWQAAMRSFAALRTTKRGVMIRQHDRFPNGNPARRS